MNDTLLSKGISKGQVSKVGKRGDLWREDCTAHVPRLPGVSRQNSRYVTRRWAPRSWSPPVRAS